MTGEYIFPYYKNKKILITGAGGYIGSAIINFLKNEECCIYALVRNVKNIVIPSQRISKIEIIVGDIRDKKFWKRWLGKIDILFHFAAQTSSYFANKNPWLDAEVNLFPIINIIDTCTKYHFHPDIVFSGTATEVGFTKDYPISENFSDSPITIYDINKFCAEKYLQYYSNQLGNRAVTLRLSNVYGPGISPSSPDRGVLNLMIKRAISGQPITVYGKGNFIRDYIYIDDVCLAFLLAGSKINVLKGNYYLIGSGKGYTIKSAFLKIKEIVEKLTSRKVRIKYIKPPSNLLPIEFRNFVADTSKFSFYTGWKASVSLEEGIERTVRWFLNKRRK